MNSPKPRLPLRHLVTMAAEHYGVSTDDLLSPSRKPIYTIPRFAVMRLGIDLGYRIITVARALGRKDHACVLHGGERALYLYQHDRFFAELIDRMRAVVENYDGSVIPLLGWDRPASDKPLVEDIAAIEPEAPSLSLDEQEEADAFAPFPPSHDEDGLRFASVALLAAIQREFPERCVAA